MYLASFSLLFLQQVGYKQQALYITKATSEIPYTVYCKRNLKTLTLYRGPDRSGSCRTSVPGFPSLFGEPFSKAKFASEQDEIM